MNTLEFLVDVTYSKLRFNRCGQYMHRWYDAAENSYIYTCAKDEEAGLEKYRMLMEFLEQYYRDCQYAEEEIINRLKRLSEIEIDVQEDSVNYNVLTYIKYPLLTVRGTCKEKTCYSPSIPIDGVLPIPCCFNQRIGCQRISMRYYPDFLEILLDILNWMMLCPALDIVYILHDSPANTRDEDLSFNLGFQVKQNKIKVAINQEEVKQLYRGDFYE